MKNGSPALHIQKVMESCLYADDLDATERFYGNLLGLPVIARETGRHVFFRCGSAVVLIFNPTVTSAEQTHINGAPVPLHGASGAGHLAFAVTASELAGWRAKMEEANVPIESHVIWPERGESIYVRDPAGNSIEFVTPELWQPGAL